MKRFLAFMLCLALAPMAWADDEDKDREKELKELRDRIIDRVSKQLEKEFDRIREEVKALLDKELGLGKKEEKPAKKEEKKPEKHAKKEPKEEQPEEKGTEKPASHEKRPGWMGVQLGMDEESGLPTIEGVFPETPAEKAGLQDGDVFLKIDGKEIESVEDLIMTVQEAGAGAKLKVTVRREGEEKTLTLKLAERPEEPEMGEPDEDEGEDLGEEEK